MQFGQPLSSVTTNPNRDLIFSGLVTANAGGHSSTIVTLPEGFAYLQFVAYAPFNPAAGAIMTITGVTTGFTYYSNSSLNGLLVVEGYCPTMPEVDTQYNIQFSNLNPSSSFNLDVVALVEAPLVQYATPPWVKALDPVETFIPATTLGTGVTQVLAAQTVPVEIKNMYFNNGSGSVLVGNVFLGTVVSGNNLIVWGCPAGQMLILPVNIVLQAGSPVNISNNGPGSVFFGMSLTNQVSLP